MPQTSYAAGIVAGFPGMLYDTGVKDAVTMAQGEASAEIPFGVVVAKGTGDVKAKLPASAADVLAGIVLHSNEYHKTSELGDTGLKPKVPMSVLRKGRVYVLLEENVSKGDPAFVRHTAKGGNTQTGGLRKTPDGTAGGRIITVTPTAVNATTYQLRVSVGDDDFSFEVLSDGSATATEICDSFRTQMAANTEFSALVTASGTATLVLTGNTVGQDFSAESTGPGTLSVASTQAAGGTAVELYGCTFFTSGTAGGVAVLEVDMDAYDAGRRLSAAGT